MSATDSAVSLESITKRFELWRSAKDVLIEIISQKKRHKEFLALDNVDLTINKGEVVGVLGRNGAGKSTLLRIIAGTLSPSSGSIVSNGKISAILELGTGFHPEYTGRENILLGGLCMGLKRDEILSKIDDIIEFSELEEFIDNPFKTYSSGMQARLTFSVATCIDPDILIVDEALGVGDTRFQLKSFDRIKKFRSAGKTILLVSHNISQVVAICDRAVLLERGKVVAVGEPNYVANLYHQLLFGPQSVFTTNEVEHRLMVSKSQTKCKTLFDNNFDGLIEKKQLGFSQLNLVGIESLVVNRRPTRRYGTFAIEFYSIDLLDLNDQPVHTLTSGELYRVHISIRAKEKVDEFHFGFLIRDEKGIEYFGWDSGTAFSTPCSGIEAGDQRSYVLNFKNVFSAGSYFVSMALALPDTTKLDFVFDILELRVAPTPSLHTSSKVNLPFEVVEIK